MEISKENIEAIEKFYNILNRGRYCVSQEVTAVYNEVFGKNVVNTNCSSCLRQRILALKQALDNYKKEQENKQ